MISQKLLMTIIAGVTLMVSPLISLAEVKIPEDLGNNKNIIPSTNFEFEKANESNVNKKQELNSWDVNGDGKGDVLDLMIIGNHFGEEGSSNKPWDVNVDGTTDILDLVFVSNHYGEVYTVPTNETIVDSPNKVETSAGLNIYRPIPSLNEDRGIEVKGNEVNFIFRESDTSFQKDDTLFYKSSFQQKEGKILINDTLVADSTHLKNLVLHIRGLDNVTGVEVTLRDLETLSCVEELFQYGDPLKVDFGDNTTVAYLVKNKNVNFVGGDLRDIWRSSFKEGANSDNIYELGGGNDVLKLEGSSHSVYADEGNDYIQVGTSYNRNHIGQFTVATFDNTINLFRNSEKDDGKTVKVEKVTQSTTVIGGQGDDRVFLELPYSFLTWKKEKGSLIVRTIETTISFPYLTADENVEAVYVKDDDDGNWIELEVDESGNMKLTPVDPLAIQDHLLRIQHGDQELKKISPTSPKFPTPPNLQMG